MFPLLYPMQTCIYIIGYPLLSLHFITFAGEIPLPHCWPWDKNCGYNPDAFHSKNYDINWIYIMFTCIIYIYIYIYIYYHIRVYIIYVYTHVYIIYKYICKIHIYTLYYIFIYIYIYNYIYICICTTTVEGYN